MTKMRMTMVAGLLALAVPGCMFGPADSDESIDQQRRGLSWSEDCTLTQGYWKTHPTKWPVTELTIGGVTYQEDELLDILHMSVTGDSSLILAHQLIATMLNIANGASAPAGTVLADADDWMAANKDEDGRLPYGEDSGTPEHEQASALADALAGYNQGQTGPGHCGEGGTTGDNTGDTGSGSTSGGDGEGGDVPAEFLIPSK